MRSAKDIVVAPIEAAAARAATLRWHYSRTFVRNSSLHIGVFLDGAIEGVMTFGPSMDKRKLVGLVDGTPWNGFLELNRMAFSERLPRNSESRALGVALRQIRRRYPHVQWVVSFADGAQCGDGTIYRAAGFVLTQIRRNETLWRGPDGTVVARPTITANIHKPRRKAIMEKAGAVETGAASMEGLKAVGFAKIPGFQLRYLYFLDPTARGRLAVPVLPFSAIGEAQAGMYRGVARGKHAMAGHPSAQRQGSTDPHAPNSSSPPSI